MCDTVGKISVFLQPQYNPITPSLSDGNRALLFAKDHYKGKDGKIISNELRRAAWHR